MKLFDDIMREAMQGLQRNVEAARDEVIKVWKQNLDRGMLSDKTLDPYAPSQKSRRRKIGRQTTVKDLWYSNTMRESVKEIDRIEGKDFIELRIGFTGQAHRRKDQKDTISNKQLSKYLGTQQTDSKNILKIPRSEITRIEQKYEVIIT